MEGTDPAHAGVLVDRRVTMRQAGEALEEGPCRIHGRPELARRQGGRERVGQVVATSQAHPPGRQQRLLAETQGLPVQPSRRPSGQGKRQGPPRRLDSGDQWGVGVEDQRLAGALARERARLRVAVACARRTGFAAVLASDGCVVPPRRTNEGYDFVVPPCPRRPVLDGIPDTTCALNHQSADPFDCGRQKPGPMIVD